MKRLYTPFKVNKLELKNRVIMSPMSIGHTVDGFIMDDVVEVGDGSFTGAVHRAA